MAATLFTTTSASQAFAANYLSGTSDIRRISMFSGRTGESIDAIYWIDGHYVEEVLGEINFFMRDWRTDEQLPIDVRVIDILAATRILLDTTEPYSLLSGYRSAKTNALLRSRSAGSVARNSLHVQGRAADVRLRTRSLGQTARAALKCSGGGVGRYSRSNFVHLDCGPVRTWGS
ncbi:MAG: DUF882 domain-containing protein [Aestuariivita sp.]|nr:DUF882 domain-containing protein [Aestuariivita sp.]MCY4288488.1 DUF882 domain-containing protein [Aestuariivita sp.]MCY4347072.1 DUF882 domain-containing protein [Aestuariivita sp.]